MILAVILGLAIGAGLLLVINGATPHTPRTKAPRPPGASSRALRAITPRFTRREKVLLAVSTAAGLVIAIFTGMIIAIPALPLVFVIVPKIISSKADEQRIEKLEALEQWTRALAGVLGTGQGMRHTLTVSQRSAPEAIAPEVSLLVARLNARRGTEESLRQLADDLNDSVGDSIAGTLILGARETGAGLQRILDGLAQTVSTEVRQRREVEAQRQGPRSEAKWLGIGIPTAFIGFMFMSRDLAAFYATPFGQMVMVALVAAFLGCIWWMRTVVATRPEPRFLASTQPDPADVQETA